MSHRKSLLVLSALLFAGLGGLEAEPERSVLDFGQAVSLLPRSPMTMEVYNGDPSLAVVRQGTDGVDGGPTIKAEVLAKPKYPWGVQLRWKNAKGVKKGDVVFARIRLRCLKPNPETGAGSVTVGMGEVNYPNFQEIEYGSSVPVDGMLVELPCKLTQDYAPGHLQLKINLGLLTQEIEVLSVEWWNFRAELPISAFPYPQLTYEGRNPEAAWRREAAERIDKIRKADLKITVLREGKPVEGAQVKIRQLSHAFGLGTCISADRLLGDSANDRKYREVLKENFERVVFESEMKWRQMAADETLKDSTRKAIGWLKENGFEIRGHNLVWPGKATLPPHIRTMLDQGDKDRLRDALRERITSTVALYRGDVAEWDVINEPVHNQDLQKALGREAMAEWFRIAHETDPGPRLFLNDYTMLSGGAVNQANIDAFYDNIAFLKAEGAPISGIGEQAHFAWQLVSPEKMLKLLDRFSTFGLPIEITEFDVYITDEQLQADYTRDFLTAAFSHPAVTGVTIWGFWAGQHWQPAAAMWREDWQEKPNAAVWRDLWFRQWRTQLDETTGPDGTVTARAFFGDYSIEVSDGAQSTTRTVTLAAGGGKIEISL